MTEDTETYDCIVKELFHRPPQALTEDSSRTRLMCLIGFLFDQSLHVKVSRGIRVLVKRQNPSFYTNHVLCVDRLKKS